MKYAVFGLMCLAAPLQAESFCGVTDTDAILSDMSGFKETGLRFGETWDVIGGLTFSQGGEENTNPLVGLVRVNHLGMISLEVEGSRGDNLFVRPDSGSYEQDDLDGFFEMTGTAWIATEIASSPCDLTDIPQLRGTYDDPNGDFNQLTIIPYSSDQVLMIAEIEALVEGGLAFVTITGLMSRTP